MAFSGELRRTAPGRPKGSKAPRSPYKPHVPQQASLDSMGIHWVLKRIPSGRKEFVRVSMELVGAWGALKFVNNNNVEEFSLQHPR